MLKCGIKEKKLKAYIKDDDDPLDSTRKFVS